MSNYISVKDYSEIRNFLRYFFLFGCYSREEFSQFKKVSLRKYDEELRRIREILGNDRLKESYKNGEKYLSLHFSYYETVENYLVEFFLSKSFTNLELSIFFHVLNILNQFRELSIDQIVYKIECIRESETSLKSSILRMLNYMTDKGMIEKHKKKNKIYYEKKKDYLEVLSNEELISLYVAILFFSQVKFPLIVGKYLKEMLLRYLKYRRGIDLSTVFPEIFLFKYSLYHQVIDEEIVWQLNRIISEKKKVLLKYIKGTKKVEIEVLPLKIIRDLRYGRWYLYCCNNNNQIQILHIQNIFSIVKFFPAKEEEINLAYRRLEEYRELNLKKVEILFRVEKYNKHNFLLDKVARERSNGEIELIDDYSFIYRIYIKDWKNLKPWIRSFGHRAKVLKSKEHELYEELKSEWQEIGENYGIIFSGKK